MFDDDDSDGGAGFGANFTIDAGGTFSMLAQLVSTMESAEGRVVASASRMEGRTRNIVELDGTTAAIKDFATAAVRDMGQVGKAKEMMDRLLGRAVSMSATGPAITGQAAATTREIAKTEAAIDKLVYAIDRETAALGRTRDEQRAATAEELAAIAAKQGNTDAADRLLTSMRGLDAARKAAAETKLAAQLEAEAQSARDAAAAEALLNSQLREREALRLAEDQSLRSASLAHAMFEARVREGAQALREQEAAEKALNRAAAAATMQAQAAAAKRAADEHQRLAAVLQASHAAQMADADAAERMRAATDPLYAATARLNAELAESTRLYIAGATPPAEYARQQEVLSGRLRAVTIEHEAMAGAVRRGSGSLTQMSFQMNDVVTMAMSGAPVFQIFATQIGQMVQVVQMAEGGFRGFMGELGGFLLRFSPIIGGLAAGAVGVALFARAVNDVDTKPMIAGLGLTRAEIKRLKDTTVDTGDVMKATFQVLAQRVGLNLSDMTGWFGDAMDFMTRAGRVALAGLYSSFVGTFRAIGAIVKGVFAGKGIGEILSDIGDGYKDSFNEANGAMKRFGADVNKQIASNKLADLRKQAAELKLDRTPKTDKHAEQLARQAEAMEAQIRNLYALADAYGVSGAAALIAEARVKAESQAIRARADVEAAVERQIRLAIAERVKTAAEGAAGMRDQAMVQEQVNREVAAGLIPAQQASDLVRDRLADLPLLAAMEAAGTLKTKEGAAAHAEAARWLDEQRRARDRLTKAERDAQLNAAIEGSNDQLALQREELRLIGATDMARVRALSTLRAEQEARRLGFDGAKAKEYVDLQTQIAVGAETNRQAQDAWNASLGYSADLFEEIDRSAQKAASGMADAFGAVGRTIGDVAIIMTGYYADQADLQQSHDAAIRKAGANQKAIAHEQQLFAMRTSSLQIGAFGDMAAAAKGFFKEGSGGYKAMAAAEKVYRVAQLAMSIQAMVQNVLETTTSVANAGARATADGAAGIAAQAKLPFPANIAAMAATGAALVAAGVAVFGGFGGSKNTLPQSNTGTGTVLGDSDAKSESLKRAIDQLREVDTVTSVFARQMAGSLRSIENQIGGLAAVLVRSGNVDASAGVTEGFKTNAVGSLLKSIVPVFGGALASLFGTKTTVVASGLYGGAQSVGSILDGGFDAQTYSDVQKKKKLFGITTSTKYSTQYGAADAGLENQFTLILRGFATAIAGAAGPLGEATDAVQARLNGFVVSIGKIDLKGLTGTEIQEKLEAVFGAAADGMANAAFPGVARFQKAGEGAFETLVRVASTLEAVSSSLDLLGSASRAMSIDAKLGLADQFDSIGDLTSAVDAYFASYFSDAEQTAAKTAQMGRVFASMGVVMPSTLAGFRQLVEAQDLTTAAGQATYATLLQLAPAFADLQKAMSGAKSAADVAAERQDLERKILELNGDTAALRALDLAKLDASNRGLQEQIYAIQDAQEAAKAAEELRQAWTSVGDSIMDEVKRIRGLTDAGGGNTFAELLGRFNAANAAARGGDMDAAKGLPALSQALLSAAADAATSRQELARVQAATAAQLEATYGVVGALTAAKPTSATAQVTAAAAAQGTPTADAANDDAAAESRALREEMAGMRRDLTSALATIAGATTRTDRRLQDMSAASGGQALSVTTDVADAA